MQEVKATGDSTIAYNEKLADRIRKVLARRKAVNEKKMFGGIAFMLRGKMCCGVLKDDLVVRVGADRYSEALTRPHARPMNFTGRPLKGFVYVGPRGYRTDRALQKWLSAAMRFVSSLEGR